MASNGGGYEVGKAYVTIIPTVKGATKAIADDIVAPAETAGKTAGEKAGGGIKAGISKGSAALAGVVGSLASKALDAIADLGGEMIATSDATDKFAQTLKFAGVGDDQIKSLTKSTRAYADATVYDLADIQNATAQLAANGVKNYDKLVEASGNLNAVAGGNKDTFKSVELVLTQTAGAGKLTTENWNQLADAIPGASGMLQDALRKNGAYTGDFRDAMAKGEITADEFNAAIMDLGYTDAAQEAAKSTSTFEGAVGNLQDAIVGVGSDLLTAIKGPATGAINWLTGVVTDIADKAGQLGTAMSNAFTGWLSSDQGQQVLAFFGSLRDTIGGFLDGAWKQLQAAFSGGGDALDLSGISGGFQRVADSAQACWDTLVPFAQQIQDNVVGTFEAFWHIVTGVAQALAPAFDYLGQAFSNIFNALTDTGNVQAFSELIGTIYSRISAAYETFASTIAPFIIKAAETLAPLVQQLGDTFGHLWEALQPVAQALGTVIAAIFDFLTQSQVVQAIATVIGATLDWVVQKLVLLVQGILAVVNGIISFIQWVMDANRFIFEFFAGLISGGNNATATVGNAFLMVRNTIAGVFDSIGRAAASVVGWIGSQFEGARNAIGGAFRSAGDAVAGVLGGFAGFARSAVDGVVGVFRGIADAITAPFRAAFSAIRRVWNDTIGGFGFTVPDWLPGVGGKSFRVPYLADGGTLTSAGTVMVGERGPELLTLPTGARVTPLDKGTQGNAGGTVYSIQFGNVNLSDDSAVQDATRRYLDYLIRIA